MQEKLQTQKPCTKESYIFLWDFGWKNKKMNLKVGKPEIKKY